MQPVVLPLSVHTEDHQVELVLRAAVPISWAQAAPAVSAAAGLSPDSQMYLGAGAVDPALLVGAPPLLAGTVLGTCPADQPPVDGALVLDCIAGPDAGGSLPLLHDSLLVGRSPRADLVLADPDMSARHARVDIRSSGVTMTDLLSTNGIRLLASAAGEPPFAAGTPQPLSIGTTVCLGGSMLRLDLSAGVPMLRQPDGAGLVRLSLPARSATTFHRHCPDHPGPPPIRERRPVPIVAAVAAAIAGMAIALLTKMWLFLLMAALGPVTMITTAIGDRIAGRRPHRRAVGDHAAAVLAHERVVADAVAADRADAWERFADPARLLRWARAGGIRLWEHRIAAPPARVGVDIGEVRKVEVMLSIGERPARLEGRQIPTVAGVPLPVSMPTTGAVGVSGAHRATVRWLLAQLAGAHSPADLRLQILSSESDLRPLADLPHCRDGAEPGSVHNGADGWAAALRRSTAVALTVAVVDDFERWRTEPGVLALLSGRDPRLLLVLITRTPAAVPASCGTLVDLDTLPGDRIGVSPRYLAELAAALAPFDVADSGPASLPRQPTGRLLDSRQLAAGWQHADAPVADIGVSAGGPLSIDLARDGPHLLIAGTTGSGKSELLQTIIAGLASRLSPLRLALLLIDYKGGAAFAEAARLPHTTGIVTDLDSRLAERALISLRAEIRCRERFLADCGATDLAAVPAADRSLPIPPRLVIVVDEFAALAAELPDFLSGLIDIAQRGRSLGLHLVLATQRPAGVVSPAIKANIAARICLRVTDSVDSTDVIDTPLAADIPAELPGRGYLRTAGGRLTEFQTLRVTAPTAQGISVQLRGDPAPPATGPVPLRTLIDSASIASASIRLPAPPWLPPLADRIELTDPTQLGILDLPDLPAQRPWRLPAGSLLIAGAAGSGRTAALRRWGQAMAASGAELLVVDGGGSLADLADNGWAATYLTAGDPQLVLRLFELLTSEAAARAGGGDQQKQQLGLMIDDWDPLAAALDTVDFGHWQTTIAELAGRGPAAGIRVAIAGGQRLSQHRVAQAFGASVQLGLPSPTGEAVPGAPTGRGRLGGSQSGEVQLAHPSPTVLAPVATVFGSDHRWVVRSLPERVAGSTLPAPTSGFVPIGLGGDAATPVGFDLAGQGGGILLAGQRRSGVSTALAVLAVGAASAGIPVVRTTLRQAAALPGVRNLDLRGGSAPLLEFLAGHSGPLLLLADDAAALSEHPAAELLTRFLAVAGEGQYLVLGCRLEVAVRSHRGPIAEAAAFRTGVLLGADAMDAAVLGAVLPRRRTPSRPGNGHLVLAGNSSPVQLADSLPRVPGNNLQT
ncbi:MAG: FtsK/SpoIIIE domain-containing protein [Actinomycetota bacterium]|nr:FtsK/SpoIIIE domain-containing protein [Actinomycetota bacterium]